MGLHFLKFILLTRNRGFQDPIHWWSCKIEHTWILGGGKPPSDMQLSCWTVRWQRKKFLTCINTVISEIICFSCNCYSPMSGLSLLAYLLIMCHKINSVTNQDYSPLKENIAMALFFLCLYKKEMNKCRIINDIVCARRSLCKLESMSKGSAWKVVFLDTTLQMFLCSPWWLWSKGVASWAL